MNEQEDPKQGNCQNAPDSCEQFDYEPEVGLILSSDNFFVALNYYESYDFLSVKMHFDEELAEYANNPIKNSLEYVVGKLEIAALSAAQRKLNKQNETLEEGQAIKTEPGLEEVLFELDNIINSISKVNEIIDTLKL